MHGTQIVNPARRGVINVQNGNDTDGIDLKSEGLVSLRCSYRLFRAIESSSFGSAPRSTAYVRRENQKKFLQYREYDGRIRFMRDEFLVPVYIDG